MFVKQSSNTGILIICYMYIRICHMNHFFQKIQCFMFSTSLESFKSFENRDLLVNLVLVTFLLGLLTKH